MRIIISFRGMILITQIFLSKRTADVSSCSMSLFDVSSCIYHTRTLTCNFVFTGMNYSLFVDRSRQGNGISVFVQHRQVSGAFCDVNVIIYRAVVIILVRFVVYFQA